MKKLILSILLIFCLAAPAYALDAAIWGVLGAAGGAAVDPYCDSCPDAANGADLACEDASDDAGDGKLCTWTDADGAGSIDWKKPHSGTWCCADKGSYALEVVTSTADTNRVRYDFGSDMMPQYAQFYINFTAESLANNERSAFIQYVKSTFVVYLRLSLYQDASGDLRISAIHSLTGALDTTTDSTTVISLNTVYRFRISWTDISLTVELAECDGSNPENILNGVDPVNSTVRYFDFGSTNTSQAASITFEADLLKLDDDTAITTGCSE